MKYKNINTGACFYGFFHRSKLEMSVCNLIRLRELAGEILHVQHEDHVLISGWYLYIPDFKCIDVKTGKEIWIEAKGYADLRWPSTKKGWRHSGPGNLEIWMGSHISPSLSEIIIPRGKKMSDEQASETHELRRLLKEKEAELARLKEQLGLDTVKPILPDPCTVGGI